MQHLFDQLPALFSVRHAEVGGGTLWVAAEPVELEPLAGPGDDRDDATLYARLDGARRLSTLLHLEWASEAPMSWEVDVRLLEDDEAGTYALLVPDAGTDDPVIVLARLQPAGIPELIDAFVSALIGGGGPPFGPELFVSPPTEIHIYRPDLLSRDAVAAGLARLAGDNDERWSDLADIALWSGDLPASVEGRLAILEEYLDVALTSEGD